MECRFNLYTVFFLNTGVFSTQLIQAGVIQNYGIFFVEIQDKFGAPTTIISLVGGVLSACYSVSGLIQHNVYIKVSLHLLYTYIYGISAKY